MSNSSVSTSLVCLLDIVLYYVATILIYYFLRTWYQSEEIARIFSAGTWYQSEKIPQYIVPVHGVNMRRLPQFIVPVYGTNLRRFLNI